MTSLVIESDSRENRIEYINNFCKKAGIDRFDITLIEKDNLIKQNIQSIGIEEIKNIHKKIFLKPLNSEMKAVIIDDAQLLTPPAQNALLKVLEEPPDHTYILLSVQSKESLLPTILSRCKIIELENGAKLIPENEKREILEFMKALPDMKIGEMLKKAEELAKDKDIALDWITKLILVVREKLLEKPNSQTIRMIKNFQELHTLLKTTNVNPRLAIETTLLNLKS